MRLKIVCWIAAAAFLILNLADFVTTWVGIKTGKGVESNPLVLMTGGPLSPQSVLLKLVVIPGIILGAAWWVSRKLEKSSAALAILTMIIPATVLYGHAVANNILIIARRTYRIAERKTHQRRRGESR